MKATLAISKTVRGTKTVHIPRVRRSHDFHFTSLIALENGFCNRADRTTAMSFSAQAVIAIENVRLLNELRELSGGRWRRTMY